MDERKLIHRGDDNRPTHTLCGVVCADHIPDGDGWAWLNDDLVTCLHCLTIMADRTSRALRKVTLNDIIDNQELRKALAAEMEESRALFSNLLKDHYPTHFPK